MRYLEDITREIFDLTAKRAFGVIYARAAVERFFQGKTMEEIDRELFQDEWICETVEQAMQWHVEATVMAAENAMIRDIMKSGIAVVIGGFNCRDESEGNPNNDEEDAGDDSAAKVQ